MTEHRINFIGVVVAIVLTVVILSTITGSEGHASDSQAGRPLVAEGRKIYDLICISCHDPDPTQDRTGGTYGPAIAGSSLELLQLRVLGTEYPEGYTPKRDTKLMTPFPLLPAQIQALYAFLNESAAAPSQSGSWWLIPVAIAIGLLLLMLFRRREELPTVRPMVPGDSAESTDVGR